MDLQADAAQRRAVYRGLQARNRVVAILRVGVPALGVVALSALMLQIYVSSSAGRFGVGQIMVSSESIMVEAPEYFGLLDDGTSYRVSATAAQAAVDATDRIGLTDAHLTMTRPDGVGMDVRAPQALLDTTNQTVIVEDVAYVGNSQGATGTIYDSVFDYVAQKLVGEGPVTLDHADGTHIVSRGMTYDPIKLVWTFSHATVTLPDTPGARSTP